MSEGPSARPSRALRCAALLLLACGVVLAAPLALGIALKLAKGRGWRLTQGWELAALAALAALTALRPIQRVVAGLVERLRAVTPRGRAWTAWAIFAAATVYLAANAVWGGRDLFPRWNDEFSYLLGARMLGEGRLWMPAHALGDFFQSFCLLTHPVYCSIYPPGTALIYAAPLLVGMAPWLVAVTLSGGVVGMTYRVIAELVDGAAGWMAALLLISLVNFRRFASMTLSHLPMALMGLAMIWVFLRWRKNRRYGWALALGALAGMGAITRPLDALCFAAPIGVATLATGMGPTLRRGAATLAVIVLGAAPFLALQLVQNRGVTGRWGQTSYQTYWRTYEPSNVGLTTADAEAYRPPGPPQFYDFYHYYMSALRERQAAHGLFYGVVVLGFGAMVMFGLTLYVLVIPLAVGVLGLRDPRRLTAAAVVPIFVLGYMTVVRAYDMGAQYALVVSPLVIMMVVLGMRVLEDVFPGARRYLAAYFALAVLLIGVCGLQGQSWAVRDVGQNEFRRDVNAKLAAIPVRAVVLFRYEYGDNFNDEPVYNIDKSWPDDERVIRAHDLGPQRDEEIFRYYAQQQSDRVFYLYDWSAMTLTRLGTATELAGR